MIWTPVDSTQPSNWGILLKDAVWTNVLGSAVEWLNESGNIVHWGTDTQTPNWITIDNSQQQSSVSWVNVNNQSVVWTNTYGNATLWGNPFSWQTINTFQ